MAKRPIFFSSDKQDSLLQTREVDFQWHPGLSVSQKQKSIESLHIAAKEQFNLNNILEISSKSKNSLGVSLSAFNLSLTNKDNILATVEAFFQGSKVFVHGGPYKDLYQKTSREAKKDRRLLDSGDLLKFSFDDKKWPLTPPTVFYDFLYCTALSQNQEQAEALLDYEAFTDIEFNPNKSINCQASSAAIYKSLVNKSLIAEAMESYTKFIKIHNKYATSNKLIQVGLF
jgi:hypothetical protein